MRLKEKYIFYNSLRARDGGEGGTLPSLRHPLQNQLLARRHYTQRSGFV
jgi:hypothetical protein